MVAAWTALRTTHPVVFLGHIETIQFMATGVKRTKTDKGILSVHTAQLAEQRIFCNIKNKKSSMKIFVKRIILKELTLK